MSDERPRPQYGEYATPEEQRDAGGFVPPTDLPPSVANPAATSPVPTDAAPTRERRSWDILATTALLSIGTYVTISSASAFLRMADVLRASYEQFGYEPYTNDALANGLGTFVVVFQSIALIAAAIGSSVSLHAGRVTWWIPLTAGMITAVITIIVLVVAMLGDPAFTGSVPGLT